MDQATAITQARYDRIAPFYDAMETFMERSFFGKLRKQLWSRISADRILEVGVGTGKNIPYYPKNSRVTAIDLSAWMVERASQKAKDFGIELDLCQMDVQKLEFPNNSFDAAVATFVFCSVPVPVQGLCELSRVTKQDGDIWLVEHVRINQPPVIGRMMDLLNPFVARMMGANINRQTVENVKLAGLQALEVLPVRGEFVKLIHARPAWSEDLDRRNITMMGFDLIFVAVIVGAIAYALGWRPKFNQTGPAQTRQTLLEILKERYVRGEITREEYEQMRRDLEGWAGKDKGGPKFRSR